MPLNADGTRFYAAYTIAPASTVYAHLQSLNPADAAYVLAIGTSQATSPPSLLTTTSIRSAVWTRPTTTTASTAGSTTTALPTPRMCPQKRTLCAVSFGLTCPSGEELWTSDWGRDENGCPTCPRFECRPNSLSTTLPACMQTAPDCPALRQTCPPGQTLWNSGFEKDEKGCMTCPTSQECRVGSTQTISQTRSMCQEKRTLCAVPNLTCPPGQTAQSTGPGVDEHGCPTCSGAECRLVVVDDDGNHAAQLSVISSLTFTLVAFALILIRSF
jgi:hypothetical protein